MLRNDTKKTHKSSDKIFEARVVSKTDHIKNKQVTRFYVKLCKKNIYIFKKKCSQCVVTEKVRINSFVATADYDRSPQNTTDVLRPTKVAPRKMPLMNYGRLQWLRARCRVLYVRRAIRVNVHIEYIFLWKHISFSSFVSHATVLLTFIIIFCDVIRF